MNSTKFNQRLHHIYWERDSKGIKSDFGKTLLIGSSKEYPNAVLIAALLCNRSGVGYCYVSTSKDNRDTRTSRLPLNQIPSKDLEERNALSKEERLKYLGTFSSILFGNGREVSEDNKILLKKILSSYSGNLIIDASGIVLLKSILNEGMDHCAPESILLTPHLGEAKRLLNIENIHSRNPNDYKEKAMAFSKKYKRTLLLKSYCSLLVDKTDCYASSYSPTAVLGKAGSGDGLAGYLAGLISYLKKEYALPEIVLFADSFIHQAAFRAGETDSPGLDNILDILPERKKRIKEAKSI